VYVGVNAPASYALSGTGALNVSALQIGTNAASGITTFTQAGGTINSTSTVVGSLGNSTFNQMGGVNNSLNVVIGNAATPANAGSGVYSLSGDKLVSASIVGGSGLSTFNFNGGTLAAAADTSELVGRLTAVNVQIGGAIVDSNGHTVTIPQALQDYSWEIATTSAGVHGFNPANVSIDTSGFANAYSGSFALSQTGNDVYLIYSAVPEPASLSMIAMGAATLMRRRRSKITFGH
jgi:fibronectin-binding autotransporter adhesin